MCWPEFLRVLAPPPLPLRPLPASARARHRSAPRRGFAADTSKPHHSPSPPLLQPSGPTNPLALLYPSLDHDDPYPINPYPSTPTRPLSLSSPSSVPMLLTAKNRIRYPRSASRASHGMPDQPNLLAALPSQDTAHPLYTIDTANFRSSGNHPGYGKPPPLFRPSTPQPFPE